MPPAWYFQSRGKGDKQDYAWSAAGPGTAGEAVGIVLAGLAGRPCPDLVDDERPGLLLYEDAERRLVLLVRCLYPAGQPRDFTQRLIRVSVLGVASAGDEEARRAVVAVAAAALREELAARIPVRYQAAGLGFTVEAATWEEAVRQAAAALEHEPGSPAPPRAARRADIRDDTPENRAAVAGELVALWHAGQPGRPGRGLVVARSDILLPADVSSLRPRWVLGDDPGEEDDGGSRRPGLDLLPGPVGQAVRDLGKAAADEAQHWVLRRLTVVAAVLLALAGGGLLIARAAGHASGGTPGPPPAVSPRLAAVAGTEAGPACSAPGTPAPPAAVRLPGRAVVAAAASGVRHSLALTAAGQVLAWGSNAVGQLGPGAPASGSALPVAVPLPGSPRVRQVSAGALYSLALTSSGRVWAWGYNASGQLGVQPPPGGTARPVPVPLPPGVTQVSAGCATSLALTSAGQVYAWGDNHDLELGRASPAADARPVPVPLPPGVTQVSAGCYHELALTRSGQVLAWGGNGDGQLGSGSAAPRVAAPALVQVPGTVVAVSAGCGQSLALTAAGQVYAWGLNAGGQLGHGTISSPRPVRVALPAGAAARAIYAGAGYSAALTGSRLLLAWGSYTAGQPAAVAPPRAAQRGARALGTGPTSDGALVIVSGRGQWAAARQCRMQSRAPGSPQIPRQRQLTSGNTVATEPAQAA